MLNPSSRLKGEKDMEKYEKARRLKEKIVKIREDYSSGNFDKLKLLNLRFYGSMYEANVIPLSLQSYRMYNKRLMHALSQKIVKYLI